MRNYVFVGPDGSGKTSLIFNIISKIQTKKTNIRVIHFSPSLRDLFSKNNQPVVTDPHALSPRSQVTSTIKIIYILIKYYAVHYHTFLFDIIFSRNTIIFWDRHLIDIIADPLRYRIKLNNLILKLIMLHPKLLQIYVVNAPPHVTLSRKAETDYNTALKVYNAYNLLISSLHSAIYIDAEQPLDHNSIKVLNSIKNI